MKLNKLIRPHLREYVHHALKYYNQRTGREFLAEQLAEESLSCREESMKVLAEFERM